MATQSGYTQQYPYGVYPLRGHMAAEVVISFNAIANFPAVGPPVIFTVVSAPPLWGCSFNGFSEPAPGILEVNFLLGRSMAANQRAETTSSHLLGLTAIDPFVPLPIITKDGFEFQQVVIANNPVQPPGSPDIVIEFHTLIHRVPHR